MFVYIAKKLIIIAIERKMPFYTGKTMAGHLPEGSLNIERSPILLQASPVR